MRNDLAGLQNLDVFASGRSKYFSITFWGQAIRMSGAQSPKRIHLCEIALPVLTESDDGELEIHDCVFLVTVPRNKGLEDIGERFALLSQEAGAACAQLPVEFQSRISSHCPSYIQTPASWWIAMLWEFHGGGVFVPPPKPKPDFIGPPKPDYVGAEGAHPSAVSGFGRDDCAMWSAYGYTQVSDSGRSGSIRTERTATVS